MVISVGKELRNPVWKGNSEKSLGPSSDEKGWAERVEGEGGPLSLGRGNASHNKEGKEFNVPEGKVKGPRGRKGTPNLPNGGTLATSNQKEKNTKCKGRKDSE